MNKHLWIQIEKIVEVNVVIKDNDVISTFFVVVEGEGDVLYNNETCSYLSIGLTFTLRTGKKEKERTKNEKKNLWFITTGR